MKHYLITSNKYIHLLKDYSTLFNKHWGRDQEVVVLGFKGPKSELPSNFSFVSLGDQADYGRSWTNPLIPFFKGVQDNYFTILLDDLFFVTPMDWDTLQNILDETKDENIDKIILSGIPPKMWNESASFTENSRILSPKADYRTTLKPSVWKKSYFMKLLKKDLSIWNFELSNMEESKGDGSTVIFSNKRDLVRHINMYRKGRLCRKSFNKTIKENIICPKDKKLIEGCFKKKT